jgi:hypothetical protein
MRLVEKQNEHSVEQLGLEIKAAAKETEARHLEARKLDIKAEAVRAESEHAASQRSQLLKEKLELLEYKNCLLNRNSGEARVEG